MDQSTVVLVAASVLLVLYVMRRKSRLSREED
jgi:hypothetical protein